MKIVFLILAIARSQELRYQIRLNNHNKTHYVV